MLLIDDSTANICWSVSLPPNLCMEVNKVPLETVTGSFQSVPTRTLRIV